MAHVEESGSRGRRANVDLNLVPFIDLMSVLITFLLITAVWTQVSMIQIGSSLYGKKTEAEEQQQVPPPQMEVVLKVDVKATGYLLTVGTQSISFPLINNQYDDAGLMAQLARIKQLYPDKQDVVLSVSDDLAYDVLIKTMDKLLMAGYPTISVATGGPN